MYGIIKKDGDNMYNYIIGVVSEIESNAITIDNHGMGYNVYVANPYSFKEGEETKVYIYHQITENGQALFGFHDKEEKDLFLRLIDVKGLGPKTALPMFATGSVNGIVDAIDRENIVYLTKFPKVGDKLARQIILDLKGKLAASSSTTNVNSELVEVLQGLGYKMPDIKKVLPNVDPSLSIEEQIKQALKYMLK
jgi:Holliday junction DNA helicase RuvA